MTVVHGMLLRMSAAAVAGYCCIAWAQAQGIQHDLFARPATAQLVRPGQGSGVAQTAAPVWKPEVKAVLVAGSDSFANVDGVVLRIGGEIDGYRLVEVRQQEVVFVKNKKRYTLPLRAVQAAQAVPEPASANKPAGVPASAPASTPEAPGAGNLLGLDAVLGRSQ